MQNLQFSFIIPVYNRPQEIKELLDSFLKLEGDYDYEIVIVEDGSSDTSSIIIDKFSEKLDISYYYKPNTGPGDSRNFGMKKAKGNYFIILDSDVILPNNYLIEVYKFLTQTYYHSYGGPDTAHSSFSNLQKAINFSMTSFITTGGIRGGKNYAKKFQPRSFNMGLSKIAFEASKGFGQIHPGEDPDLYLRLQQLGFKTTLIPEAKVYHKRRISFKKFYNQVYKFGLARPILNHWHPKYKSVIYWLPTLFWFGFLVALILLSFGMYHLILIYLAYVTIAFVLALIESKNITIGFYSTVAILIQFFGYGYGFVKSTFYISILKKQPEKVFPFLFFKKA